MSYKLFQKIHIDVSIYFSKIGRVLESETLYQRDLFLLVVMLREIPFELFILEVIQL